VTDKLHHLMLLLSTPRLSGVRYSTMFTYTLTGHKPPKVTIMHEICQFTQPLIHEAQKNDWYCDGNNQSANLVWFGDGTKSSEVVRSVNWYNSRQRRRYHYTLMVKLRMNKNIKIYIVLECKMLLLYDEREKWRGFHYAYYTLLFNPFEGYLI
jgi:hypothetical protein